MAPHPSPNIVLYGGSSRAGEYAGSPFVAKLEARLRFGGLSYKTVAGSPVNAPRGKIPYVAVTTVEESAPIMLSDSSLISATFTEQGLLKDLNADLTPTDRVHDLSIRALLEDKLYFYQVHERWLENYYTQRDSTFAFMPYPIRIVVGTMVFRQISTTLKGQGTGRFNLAEISDFRKQIWAQVNALLDGVKKKSSESGPFWVMGGSQPTEVDTTVFGFIVSGLVCSSAPESMEVIKSYPVLTDYARRIHEQYFPDYTLWE